MPYRGLQHRGQRKRGTSTEPAKKRIPRVKAEAKQKATENGGQKKRDRDYQTKNGEECICGGPGDDLVKEAYT